MTTKREDGLFSERIRRIIHATAPCMEPEDLLRFLGNPNPSLGGRYPWDLILDSHEREFEQLVAMATSEAKQGELHGRFLRSETP